MNEARLDLGGELAFEHLGSMRCEGRLLLCDVQYFDPNFAGMRRGAVGLDAELEVMAGNWQVLLVRDPEVDADDSPMRFVLLAHEDELETPTPLDQAEAIALVRVDSGRITTVDAELRDNEVIATALVEAPREQVPCMLTAPGEREARGALIDIDLGGVFELYAGPGSPRSSLFLALTSD